MKTLNLPHFVRRNNVVIHKILHPAIGLAYLGFMPSTEERLVRIMAVAENYAMVRRKGSMPYIAPVSELFALVGQPDDTPRPIINRYKVKAALNR